MDRSRERWAEALGVEPAEVVFGPSTSMNTYVLAHAFGDVLRPGDEVIVTNQDHEANTGAIRQLAERVGCTISEWRTDPDTGLLDIDDFEAMVSERTRLVTVPHASNIVGSGERRRRRITQLAHARRRPGDRRRGVVRPALDPRRRGARRGRLPVQPLQDLLRAPGADGRARRPDRRAARTRDTSSTPRVADKRLNPAGPDHAQVAASGAVLDYVEALAPTPRRSTSPTTCARPSPPSRTAGVRTRMR